MAAEKPFPGTDVPVIDQQTGLMKQVWVEFFQYLVALLKSTAASLAALVPVTIDGVGGAFTIGYALSRSSQNLTTALTSTTGALGVDVALNNTANYFDGPSIAQGSTGTWLVTGTVCVTDSLAGVVQINCKLWDGTTVIASTAVKNQVANFVLAVTLSGVITSPAGNLRISCNDVSATSGKILFNQSGNSKDSHITAVRIA